MIKSNEISFIAVESTSTSAFYPGEKDASNFIDGINCHIFDVEEGTLGKATLSLFKIEDAIFGGLNGYNLFDLFDSVSSYTYQLHEAFKDMIADTERCEGAYSLNILSLDKITIEPKWRGKGVLALFVGWLHWNFKDRAPLVLLKAYPLESDEATFEADSAKLIAHYEKHGFTRLADDSPYLWLDLNRMQDQDK